MQYREDQIQRWAPHIEFPDVIDRGTRVQLSNLIAKRQLRVCSNMKQVNCELRSLVSEAEKLCGDVLDPSRPRSEQNKFREEYYDRVEPKVIELKEQYDIGQECIDRLELQNTQLNAIRESVLSLPPPEEKKDYPHLAYEFWKLVMEETARLLGLEPFDLADDDHFRKMLRDERYFDTAKIAKANMSPWVKLHRPDIEAYLAKI